MREWLKEARTQSGLTLKQLSENVGVSWQSLAYYESGERRPSPDVAKRIGGFLGFDWTRFYEDKPIDDPKEAV